MLEAIIAGLIIFVGCTASFIAGYKFRDKNTEKYHTHTIASKNNTTITLADPIGESIRAGDKIVMTQSEEPSGIIQRPSSEELNKMNEDKDIKESKEEMVRVIREAEEPTI